jgi:hypothetical protein
MDRVNERFGDWTLTWAVFINVKVQSSKVKGYYPFSPVREQQDTFLFDFSLNQYLNPAAFCESFHTRRL